MTKWSAKRLSIQKKKKRMQSCALLLRFDLNLMAVVYLLFAMKITELSVSLRARNIYFKQSLLKESVRSYRIHSLLLFFYNAYKNYFLCHTFVYYLATYVFILSIFSIFILILNHFTRYRTRYRHLITVKCLFFVRRRDFFQSETKFSVSFCFCLVLSLVFFLSLFYHKPFRSSIRKFSYSFEMMWSQIHRNG